MDHGWRRECANVAPLVALVFCGARVLCTDDAVVIDVDTTLPMLASLPSRPSVFGDTDFAAAPCDARSAIRMQCG